MLYPLSYGAWPVRHWILYTAAAPIACRSYHADPSILAKRVDHREAAQAAAEIGGERGQYAFSFRSVIGDV